MCLDYSWSTIAFVALHVWLDDRMQTRAAAAAEEEEEEEEEDVWVMVMMAVVEGEDEEAEGVVAGTVNRLLLLYHRFLQLSITSPAS